MDEVNKYLNNEKEEIVTEVAEWFGYEDFPEESVEFRTGKFEFNGVEEDNPFYYPAEDYIGLPESTLEDKESDKIEAEIAEEVSHKIYEEFGNYEEDQYNEFIGKLGRNFYGEKHGVSVNNNGDIEDHHNVLITKIPPFKDPEECKDFTSEISNLIQNGEFDKADKYLVNMNKKLEEETDGDLLGYFLDSAVRWAQVGNWEEVENNLNRYEESYEDKYKHDIEYRDSFRDFNDIFGGGPAWASRDHFGYLFADRYFDKIREESSEYRKELFEDPTNLIELINEDDEMLKFLNENRETVENNLRFLNLGDGEGKEKPFWKRKFGKIVGYFS
jgi:hypothetical protein